MSAGPTHGHNNFLRKKVAFVLIDGIGDVSIPQLFSRTPLEAANVRYLDAVAGSADGSADTGKLCKRRNVGLLLRLLIRVQMLVITV